MGKARLRKKDRITMAGKGCNSAQYKYGKPKRKDKVFGEHPKESVESLLHWVEKHTTKRGAK